MGHARAYLSFDIFRRVLSSYFNYGSLLLSPRVHLVSILLSDLLYIMNITNIDDKIIKRARQNHLYERYLTTNRSNASQVFEDVNRACQHFEIKRQAENDIDKQKMMTDIVSFFKFPTFRCLFNWPLVNKSECSRSSRGRSTCEEHSN